MNRLKDRSLLSILLNISENFEKIELLFIIKCLEKLRIQETYLNIIKTMPKILMTEEKTFLTHELTY